MAKRWHALLEENKGRLRRSAIEERRNLSCYLDVPLICSVEVGILNQYIYQYPSDGHLVKFMFIHYIKHQQVTVTLYLVIILFFPLSSVHVCTYVCMYVSWNVKKTCAFDSETPDWANYLTSLSLSFLDHTLDETTLELLTALESST